MANQTNAGKGAEALTMFGASKPSLEDLDDEFELETTPVQVTGSGHYWRIRRKGER